MRTRITQSHIAKWSSRNQGCRRYGGAASWGLTNKTDLIYKACADIAAELIASHDAGTNVNLNGLKNKYSRKYRLVSQPRLVDIMSAIPEQYKPYLLPRLKAKPVRTASGV